MSKGVFVCTRSWNMKHKSSTWKYKRRMGIEFCLLTRLLLPPLLTGPLSSLPLPPSLYPSLFSILSLSTPSLSVMLKHLVRSAVSGAQWELWGCYLGLLQQTESSLPKCRGSEERVKSHAQLSQAGTRSAFQLRGGNEKLQHRQERRAERESDSER